MSRLQKYITEESDKGDNSYDPAITTIIRGKCKPYLSIMKGKQGLWKSLMDSPAMNVVKGDNGLGLKMVRKNRTASGFMFGHQELKYLNKWLKENGHCSRNESLIASGSYKYAVKFGGDPNDVYAVFPIGQFKYTWIKSKDLNLSHSYDSSNDYDIFKYYIEVKTKVLDKAAYGGYEKHWWVPPSLSDMTMEEGLKYAERKVLPKLLTSNKGIKDVVSKGWEIWIDCNEYYFTQNENVLEKLGVVF